MNKKLKKILELSIVFILLYFVCKFANLSVVIKGIYKDDLNHWSWFRGLNLYDFAIKFYEGTRYRPVFNIIQYIIYMIVDNNPFRFLIINEVYNALVALFIYYLVYKLSNKRIISFLTSITYLVSHYSYYQISQAIGSLETSALLFSLIILYYCLKLSGIIKSENVENEKHNNIKYIIILLIMIFIVTFTHERYAGLFFVIFISIIFAKNYDARNIFSNYKFIAFVAMFIEGLIICFIRFLGTGKIIPAGTGGTFVEETFNIRQFIKHIVNQVLGIFGINIGPDYLYGIDFAGLENEPVKRMLFISIGIILILLLAYYLYKLVNRCDFRADAIFLSFIILMIAASSVTIRVEMRFIYVSFIVSFIYLSYIFVYIYNLIDKKALRPILLALFALAFLLRYPVEFEYRKYYKKIHCFMDLSKVNSIYDETIGKYGVDDVLKSKKIYIVNQFFDMTDFYAEYILKIYDKSNVGNPIIVVDDLSKIDIYKLDNDTIILCEDVLNNAYYTFYPNET